MGLREGRGSLVIDVHAHFVPIGLVDRVSRSPNTGVSVRRHGEGRYSFLIEGTEPTRILPTPLMDLDLREAWMDQQGIDVQVVGTWADVFGYSLDRNKGGEWARYLNETLMVAISESPRFAAFASLPMQDPTRAAEMIPGVIRDGFVGVTVATRIGEMELDSEELEDFWAALDESRAVVFIHPGYEATNPRTSRYGMVNSVGRPLDTTIAAARLLGAGIPQRYPGATIVLAHGGGAIAFVLGRLRRHRDIDPSVGDPGEELERVYFDSVVFDPDALCHLVAKVSSDRVLMGSDYPFPIGDHSPKRVVDSAHCLDEEGRTAILGDNCRALLGITR